MTSAAMTNRNTTQEIAVSHLNGRLEIDFSPEGLRTGIVRAKPTGPDPFDPAALRLSGETLQDPQVTAVLTAVPVRRPDKAWFVRTRPGEDNRLTTMLLEHWSGTSRELYLVAPELRHEFGELLTPTTLFTAVNRHGSVFLWPVKIPGGDGRANPWHASGLRAAELAQTAWVRVWANMDRGAYDARRAVGPLPEPEWPVETLHDLLRIAFGNRYIASADHPVLRGLRGEC